MRRLTPVEAALLQRFPASVFDNVDIDEKLKYKQLGNAVPVGLVQFCAHWLINEQPAK
jgi:site-specific DNA-cytosine methylase